ncbi:hypothetical protein PPERSA_06691 [Pseudocohnilembus persalinus]|uniref:Uncharacterized protein n=1 Tax=Pseudocohnilembus persalinus TaxID=266149 RepID=A0A0V0QSB5_PSEPJ|nr:hypothetical protein PPERSA_06691 [Pseudocohnilembus persalinus]|eukprot:KRX05057.1 hypothetical protein PPERSA_06691 [Pseudocohnilembus persalinus]
MEKQLQYNKQFSPRNKLKQKNSGEQSLHSQIYQNNNLSNQSQNNIDDGKKIVQSQPVQYKAKKKSNNNTGNTNDSQGQNNISNNINSQTQKLPNLIQQKDPVKIELKNKMEQQSELINKLKKQIERSPRVGNLKEMEQKMDLIRTKKGFLPRQRSAETGIFVERVGSSYFQIIENLLNSSIQLHDDLQKKYESQIKENLEMINKLVSEKKELEGSIRKLKSQNIVSENLYKITKINSDSLQTEVQMLSDLLKKDIQSMVNHLGDVEKYQQEQKEKLLSNNKASDPTEKLMSGLDDLNNMIDTLSVEHKSKDNFLNTMNGLLKAMLKGTKKDAFTQVDEGELIWSPNQIYISDFQNVPYPSDLTSLGINLGNTNDLTFQQHRSNKNERKRINKLPNSLKKIWQQLI